MSEQDRGERGRKKPSPSAAGHGPGTDRAARLAEQLRANLKKRKALARTRGDSRNDGESG